MGHYASEMCPDKSGAFLEEWKAVEKAIKQLKKTNPELFVEYANMRHAEKVLKDAQYAYDAAVARWKDL